MIIVYYMYEQQTRFGKTNHKVREAKVQREKKKECTPVYHSFLLELGLVALVLVSSFSFNELEYSGLTAGVDRVRGFLG